MCQSGAPDRIRTCDLRLRRPTLYPAELRALTARTIAPLLPDVKHTLMKLIIVAI